MDEPKPDTTPEPDDAGSGEPGTTSFFQMFFVPMLIASVLTGVIVFFSLIGGDDKSVGQYLKDVRLGSQHQRWQAAFELAYRLQEQGDAARVTDEERREALRAFEDSARDPDPRIREYLALALGQMRCQEAVPALLAALDDASDRTRVYSMMSLGAIGDARAEAPLVARLTHQDPGTRKAAAFALGALSGPSSREGLRKALHDPVPDVGWNAALSLARLGDAAGEKLLLAMLDRDGVARTPEILPAQVTDVVEGAARAVGALKIEAAVPRLTELSRSDPDHKVREAASRSLDVMAGTP